MYVSGKEVEGGGVHWGIQLYLKVNTGTQSLLTHIQDEHAADIWVSSDAVWM
jgi:hypothetical protein